MGHPITSDRRSILIYSVVWLIIALVHGLLLWHFQRFSPSVVIAETLLSSVLFSLLGLLAWYPTRYIPFQRHNPLYSILAHTMAGLLVLLTWLLLPVGVLNAIFAGQEEYIAFLNKSIVWRAVMGGMVYLVLVLIYYLASYGQKLRERTQQEEKLRHLVRDAELNLLKSQINPHFLFNSLNSISSLILSNPEEARDMIIRLSDFLRYSLKHRENEFVPMKEEMGRMKDYLAIEKIRFGEKLQYVFDISTGCEEVLVPTMIFQPLFENAIRHSVYESVEPVSVAFRCRAEDGFMRTEVSNDYDPGVPSRKGTGVGLQNVKQRVELAYEGKGSVRWKGENGKFEVTIFFPRIFTRK